MQSTITTEIREFRRALRRLERFITANVKDNSTCCGVTPTQCHLLLQVEEAGEISPSALLEYLGLDKSSLSRTIDGLVRLSLLRRKTAPHDRRYNTISLTEQGRAFVDRLNGECDRYYLPVYEALPMAVRERILEDFDALFEAFSSITAIDKKRSCCSVETTMIEGKEL
jgi:DNA-binding MarR family transcriptional regulator